MTRILVGWLGTAASVAGLLVTVPPNRPLAWALVSIGGCFFLFLLITDLVEFRRHQPKKFKTPQKIRAFMRNWIALGSRVAIFTRDMTWADSKDIRDLLVRKARADELTICCPKSIAITDELALEGARIVTYGHLGYVPLSRFTIVHDGRDDSHVAVGRRINNVHVIEEFSNGSHPVFAVTKDLVEMLRRFGDSQHPVVE